MRVMIEIKPYEDLKYTRNEAGHIHPPESIRLLKGSILEVVDTFGHAFTPNGSWVCIAEVKKKRLDGREERNLPSKPSVQREEPPIQPSRESE